MFAVAVSPDGDGLSVCGVLLYSCYQICLILTVSGNCSAHYFWYNVKVLPSIYMVHKHN